MPRALGSPLMTLGVRPGAIPRAGASVRASIAGGGMLARRVRLLPTFRATRQPEHALDDDELTQPPKTAARLLKNAKKEVYRGSHTTVAYIRSSTVHSEPHPHVETQQARAAVTIHATIPTGCIKINQFTKNIIKLVR